MSKSKHSKAQMIEALKQVENLSSGIKTRWNR